MLAYTQLLFFSPLTHSGSTNHEAVLPLWLMLSPNVLTDMPRSVFPGGFQIQLTVKINRDSMGHGEAVIPGEQRDSPQCLVSGSQTKSCLRQKVWALEWAHRRNEKLTKHMWDR